MKKFHPVSLVFMLLLCVLVRCTRPDTELLQEKQGSPDEWFRDAKFGMFIHWGAYSTLAGEWNGKQVPVGENAEWIMKNLQIPVSQYREIAKEMNPVRFNAREWVKLAKSTGMKYIVITAKHHDGFAMYNSQVTDYNITDWTKFGRDPLKELSDACAEEGIKFCFYYSHREDWEHPGGYGNNWDYDNDWGSVLFDKDKFTRYLEEKAKPQVRELMTNYGPVGLVWFDRGMFTMEQGLDFVNLVHGLQPGTLINGRVGSYDMEFIGDYQSMSDNGMPAGGVEEYWETPMTLNQTWGYSKYDSLWKDPKTVITRLVEIVSRGGNFLLNIGPMGNGQIPEKTVSIFNSVGSWIDRYGEGIYGTTANPFGELPWGYCTVKGSKLYLFVSDPPSKGELVIAGLHNKVVGAEMLSGDKGKPVVDQRGDSIYIKIPVKETDSPFTVVALEIEGKPSTDPPLTVQQPESTVLDYLTANTYGNAVTRFNRKGGFHISRMTAPADSVQWVIKFNDPGKFRIEISYAARAEWEGLPYRIAIDGYIIDRKVVPAEGWYEYRDFPVGYIEIKNPGNHVLSIKPMKEGDKYLMYLKSITLVPVEEIKTQGWTGS